MHVPWLVGENPSVLHTPQFCYVLLVRVSSVRGVSGASVSSVSCRVSGASVSCVSGGVSGASVSGVSGGVSGAGESGRDVGLVKTKEKIKSKMETLWWHISLMVRFWQWEKCINSEHFFMDTESHLVLYAFL